MLFHDVNFWYIINFVFLLCSDMHQFQWQVTILTLSQRLYLVYRVVWNFFDHAPERFTLHYNHHKFHCVIIGDVLVSIRMTVWQLQQLTKFWVQFPQNSFQGIVSNHRSIPTFIYFIYFLICCCVKMIVWKLGKKLKPAWITHCFTHRWPLTNV